ncbi:hypothetical protein [Allisonella histaminiformans]|jgi:hypothetical protein|uniref:hypothetical protein n=1 Tax=Allisonella histaminiformans TaxID=209880 RepID=UPI000D7AFD71|nr:hypothetical protein [Allisonella histaminiformans]PWL45089.1 MAG: hypothetical protein DBY44_06815 [Veillonellaceae bacterium]
MKHQMEPGLPFTDEMRKWFSGTYPQGEISESRGRHFVLEPDKKYVVRAGEHAVIMPRMAYGREAVQKILEIYGKETQVVGEKDLSGTCSHNT